MEKTPWWKYVLAILAFWALLIFGESLFRLFQLLLIPKSFRYSDWLISVIGIPAGAFLGMTAMFKIVGEDKCKFCGVHFIIGASLFLLLFILFVINHATVQVTIGTGIAAFVLSLYGVFQLKDGKGNKQE